MSRVKSSSGKTLEIVTGTTGSGEAVKARVQSLEPRLGHMLSSLEEAVVRMHHGVSVKAGATLATNGIHADLMRTLQAMESRAFEESGRIDDLPDMPFGKRRRSVNVRTLRLIAELKKRCEQSRNDGPRSRS